MPHQADDQSLSTQRVNRQRGRVDARDRGCGLTCSSMDQLRHIRRDDLTGPRRYTILFTRIIVVCAQVVAVRRSEQKRSLFIPGKGYLRVHHLFQLHNALQYAFEPCRMLNSPDQQTPMHRSPQLRPIHERFRFPDRFGSWCPQPR